ncbi:hypothetical protein LTS18_009949, partial [Coniosporium uncinatum]
MEVKRNYSAGIGSVIVQAPRALSTDIIRFRNKRAEDLKGRRYDQSRRFHKRTVSKRNKMTITHVVMFEFNSKVKDEDIADTCKRMLDLKDKCLHPETNRPYIKTGTGGKQNSPEGMDGGITHVF